MLLAGIAAGRGDEVVEGLKRVCRARRRRDPAARARRSPPVATAFAYVGRMYVIGRGIEFATAREIALKLTETCRVAAEPLTSTGLSHGPIAALDSMFPVWTIGSRDESLPALVEAASRVREAGATIVASGSAAEEIEGAALAAARARGADAAAVAVPLGRPRPAVRGRARTRQGP